MASIPICEGFLQLLLAVPGNRTPTVETPPTSNMTSLFFRLRKHMPSIIPMFREIEVPQIILKVLKQPCWRLGHQIFRTPLSTSFDFPSSKAPFVVFLSNFLPWFSDEKTAEASTWRPSPWTKSSAKPLRMALWGRRPILRSRLQGWGSGFSGTLW